MVTLTVQGDDGTGGEESLFQLFIEDKPGQVHFFSGNSLEKASYWNRGESVSVVFDKAKMKISFIDFPSAYIQLLKGDRPGQLLTSEEGFDWLLEGSVRDGKRGSLWKIAIEFS